MLVNYAYINAADIASQWSTSLVADPSDHAEVMQLSLTGILNINLHIILVYEGLINISCL